MHAVRMHTVSHFQRFDLNSLIKEQTWQIQNDSEFVKGTKLNKLFLGPILTFVDKASFQRALMNFTSPKNLKYP